MNLADWTYITGTPQVTGNICYQNGGVLVKMTTRIPVGVGIPTTLEDLLHKHPCSALAAHITEPKPKNLKMYTDFLAAFLEAGGTIYHEVLAEHIKRLLQFDPLSVAPYYQQLRKIGEGAEDRAGPDSSNRNGLAEPILKEYFLWLALVAKTYVQATAKKGTPAPSKT